MLRAHPSLTLPTLVLSLAALAACGGGSDATGTPAASTAGESTTPIVPGALAFNAATVSVAQSAGAVNVAVTRSGGSDGSASVQYATLDGSAAAGAQYTAASGMLTWPAGDVSVKTLSIALSTAGFSGSKNFSITLKSPGGASLGTPSTQLITISGSATAPVTGIGSGPSAALAAKLGAPSRLLLGLGEQGGSDPVSLVHALNVKADIYTRYLGSGDWTAWNAPPCDYVCVVYQAADSIGAIPMYTQYQMANNGDGNTAVIGDQGFMTTYWARLKLLFQDLGSYGKPALVNLEPDFWGYVERASNGNPATLAAKVTINADCSDQANNVAGVAQCMIAMARKYAPQAYVGFPPSAWGGNDDAAVVSFMNAVGAQHGDFIVQQTSDRDVGCYEAGLAYCPSLSAGTYWDEANQTHPNFQDHLKSTNTYHTGIGDLPVIWWQTPQGVPANTPGGTPTHFRDNREHYFLTNPSQLTAVGGLAVVFSTGESHQTTIATDGGQYQSLSSQYLANPARLP